MGYPKWGKAFVKKGIKKALLYRLSTFTPKNITNCKRFKEVVTIKKKLRTFIFLPRTLYSKVYQKVCMT